MPPLSRLRAVAGGLQPPVEGGPGQAGLLLPVLVRAGPPACSLFSAVPGSTARTGDDARQEPRNPWDYLLRRSDFAGLAVIAGEPPQLLALLRELGGLGRLALRGEPAAQLKMEASIAVGGQRGLAALSSGAMASSIFCWAMRASPSIHNSSALSGVFSSSARRTPWSPALVSASPAAACRRNLYTPR